MSRRNGVRMSSLLITLLLCAVPAWTQVVHQFGKRGVDPCQRQSFQSKCVQDNGSTERSQFVLRYYRKGDECVSYPYGRCPGDDVESSLFRYKEACISYCVNRKGLLSTLASKETKDDDAVELFPPKEFELAALRLSDDSGTCMKPKDRGPCDKYELRFYYNKQAKRCKYFFYGGCNGNDNNFEKLVDCQQTCETQGENTTFASAPVPLREQDTTQSRSLDATTVSSGAAPVNLCDHQTDTGTCGGAFQRWSYKADSNECEQFIYTGCGGNGNNFATKQECQTACVVLPPNICDHPRDSGPCSGSFTRFFYDNDQNKCVEFNYGGCEGNGNNFPNIDTCETQCDQKVEGDFFPARNPVVATETRCPPVDCQALHINCISVTRQDGCHTCACPEGIPGLTPATPPLIGATPRFTPALAETTETPTEGPPGAPGLQPPPDFFREQSIEVNRRNSSESFGTSAAPRCRVVDCQPTCIRVQQPNGCDECLCSTAATPEATDQSSIPTSSGCPTISESDCPVPQCIKFRDNRNCVKCACPLESPTSGPSDPQPLNVVEQQQPTQVAPTPTTPTRTPAARLPPSEVPAPSLSRQNVCFLDKDAGPCRDWVVRYFYNGQSRRCEPFQYGGCSGNQNHFYNEQQCVDHCERLTPDSQRPPLARQPIQPTLSPVVQQQPFVPSPPPQFGGQQFGGPPQQFGGPPPQFGGPPQQFGGPPQQFGGPPPQFGGPPPPVGGPPGFNPGPTDGRPGGRRRPTSSVDGSFCAEMNLSICQPPCLIRTLLDGCQECMCNGPNPNRGRNNNQGPNSRVFGDRGFEDQGRNVFPDYEFIDDFGSPVNTNIRRTEPFHGGNDIGVVPSGYQPPRFEPFGGPIGSGIVVPPPSFSQPQNSFERVGTAGRVIPFPNAPVDVGFAGPASIYGPPRRSGFHRSAVIEGDPDTISTGLTVNASEFLNGNHDSKLRRHPARLPSANDNKQVCALPMQRGTCEGSHLRWYYDAVSSMCRLFYYSGCEGNDNNFESKNRCQSACSSMATSEDRTLRLCPGNTEPLGSPVPVPCGPGAVACPTGYYCSVNHLCCENNGGSDASAVAFSFEPLKLVAASAEDAFQASRRNNPVISGFCNKPETTASNCESDSFNSGRQIFYYFDVISNACHPYFYKGCAGNFSGLTSKDDCEKICKS